MTLPDRKLNVSFWSLSDPSHQPARRRCQAVSRPAQFGARQSDPSHRSGSGPSVAMVWNYCQASQRSELHL